MNRHKDRQGDQPVLGQAGERSEETSGRIWAGRIDAALTADRFHLLMQPILDLRRHKIAGYEVLLRMVEANGSLVPPATFLGAAERTGRMQAIDRWVVRRAIRILAEQARSGRRLRLSVNLSGRAFADAGLLPLITQVLADERVDPGSLILEITETQAIPDMEQAREFMKALSSLGCQFAIDDFGAGFSSIYYLKHLPVDYVKIDGSFIHNIVNDPVDRELTKALVEVARVLGKKTIAEFVGDAETLRILEAYGVDFAQGFYIGPPGPLT